jgi:hypothetical protein
MKSTMNNEIVLTITQGKISIPLEFEIHTDEINLIIGTSINELFFLIKPIGKAILRTSSSTIRFLT